MFAGYTLRSDPGGQIIHARLRMDCSSLNSDLIHIVLSYSYHCGGFENVQHFFFTCPNYTVARESYLPADLRSYSVKELMHGKANLSPQVNETISCKYRMSSLSLEDLYSIPSRSHQLSSNVLNDIYRSLMHSF